MKITNWKEKLTTSLILLICIFAYWHIPIRCFVKTLFGIPCPGCGMTRAYVRLLQFDVVGAFRLHPMFWAAPILYIYYLFDWKIIKSKWINDGMLVLIGMGFLVNWIINLLHYF